MSVERETQTQSRDPLFVAILVAVGCVTLWLLLMPFCPAIARVTMRRFHLATDSFALWAIQAPIPSMYNFGNQFEIRELPEGLVVPFLVGPVLEPPAPRYINHFPTRRATFAFGRGVLLNAGQDRWVTFWSAYRGQTLQTKIHLKPIGPGEFEWVRESSQFIQPQGGER